VTNEFRTIEVLGARFPHPRWINKQPLRFRMLGHPLRQVCAGVEIQLIDNRTLEVPCCRAIGGEVRPKLTGLNNGASRGDVRVSLFEHSVDLCHLEKQDEDGRRERQGAPAQKCEQQDGHRRERGD
jgi:hypothetical protein